MAGVLLDCLCIQGEYPACQILDQHGHVILRRARLREGEVIKVCAALRPGEAGELAGLCCTAQALSQQIASGIPSSVRRCLLHCQDGWAADDQIAYALMRLQREVPGLKVIDPLQAMHALATGGPDWLPEMPRAHCLPWQAVSAICVQGHWVLLHWRFSVGAMHAWSSDPSTLACEIDQVHSVFAKAVGARLCQFRFAHASVIQEDPGQCGWVALCAHAERLQVAAPEAWVAAVIKDFRSSLRGDGNVRAPLLLAG